MPDASFLIELSQASRTLLDAWIFVFSRFEIFAEVWCSVAEVAICLSHVFWDAKRLSELQWLYLPLWDLALDRRFLFFRSNSPRTLFLSWHGLWHLLDLFLSHYPASLRIKSFSLVYENVFAYFNVPVICFLIEFSWTGWTFLHRIRLQHFVFLKPTWLVVKPIFLVPNGGWDHVINIHHLSVLLLLDSLLYMQMLVFLIRGKSLSVVRLSIRLLCLSRCLRHHLVFTSTNFGLNSEVASCINVLSFARSLVLISSLWLLRR